MFSLTKEQSARVSEFIKAKRAEYTGAIGGQFTWSFTPTTLGCVCKVKDNISGEELDVSDYDMW
jgi:hypothetical protein